MRSGRASWAERSDGGESVVCLLHLVKERLDKFERAGAQSAALSEVSTARGTLLCLKMRSAPVRGNVPGPPVSLGPPQRWR